MMTAFQYAQYLSSKILCDNFVAELNFGQAARLTITARNRHELMASCRKLLDELPPIGTMPICATGAFALQRTHRGARYTLSCNPATLSAELTICQI